ncbi:MAG: hypothetical protein ABL995_06940 [Bryobacteraceae bacterium]
MRCVAFLGTFLFVIAARADTIELRNGQKVEGILKQTINGNVVVEVAGQSITFAVDKVRAIYFGSLAGTRSTAQAWTPALDAIRGLRSVVKGGVAYRDYAPRVLDAKVIVDRYLGTNDGPAKVRSSIKLAMDLYVLASRIWNVKIADGDYAALGKELKTSFTVSACGPAKQRVGYDVTASSKPENDVSTLGAIGRDFADQPQLLWGCAGDKVADAESAADAP